jgi:protein-S-isoprenylcysteine O-methyltransferase Ste14
MSKHAIQPAPNTGLRLLLRPQVLDRIEQVGVVVLWALMTWRVYLSENPYGPLLVLSESAVVLFVLIRRPTANISVRSGDWYLAITATFAPLLIAPVGATPAPAMIMVGKLLVFLGIIVQAWAKLVLRRSFGIAPANRGVKVGGPYRFVRHPMYAGYLATHVGLLMLLFSPLNAVIYAIGWWAQIKRLLAEEWLLSEDSTYRNYAHNVRWRLIPGIF